ncbi:WD domain, G-beta repeat protein [Onchocerca flexuosa]|uniref:Intraflagellar transport protein 122 homolog n=2 Tax=Onchocerca flexuosa TaxID=387005 RepID=A0A238C1R1_9BILA|nr:WD domain, G-beta repeat protein [Onchocerca flexuosa]
MVGQCWRDGKVRKRCANSRKTQRHESSLNIDSQLALILILLRRPSKSMPWGNRCCVYDLAFKPDGSELLVAADTKVLIYDGTDGTLLQSLKGHKDLVYAVAFSYNGENFASGSADRSVIIWTEQHEGTLKYIHNEAVQCLAFSPITCFLLSCAISDFGIWTQLEKSVSKQRTSSRCVCCSWSCDGQFYAIGMFDGTVSLRSAANSLEIKKIERPSGEPIWALAFAGPRNTAKSLFIVILRGIVIPILREGLLVLVDWGQTAAFYDLDGNQLFQEDKKLGYDPTAIEFFNYGQFLIICGSNRQVTLYSREGTTLGTVAQMDTWVWTVKARPNTNTIVVGCVDGTLACYQLMFSTVHGLHKERYAYRENMTEVVVQNLANQTSIRIYCNDLVRKVAVYYNRLAVQLADRVEIYRLVTERDDGQLEYRLVEKINRAFDCSLLVVCAHHLILCHERRLQCYDHKGLKQREWLLESLIRYIKVIGGPPGREAMLIGLRNGAVCKIFVDNPFITEILRLKSAVRCLDISHLREKLAIVDETGVCTTFDIKTKQFLFQEPSCNSVAWNADQENLLCYSGGGALCIKADNFSSHQQRMQGFVVGFSGKRVFCLHMFAMTAVEVPLSNQLYQYLEQKMYKEAYDLASLGVTEGDWDVLGHDALHNFQLDIAQKAFHRIKDARYLQLISEIKDMIKKDKKIELMLGCIKAYEGRYREAAVLFQKIGCDQKTLEMFTDLRMFDQAQELLSSASGETQKDLLRRRADWAQNSNEPIIAAEMFVASGDYAKAVSLMIKNNWIDMLINLAHRIDRSNVDVLRTIGNYLAKKGEYTLASHLFQSINDIRALINMYVDAALWNDAFLTAAKYQKYDEEVYLPYAPYHMAGHDVEALQVLEQLMGNAIKENRFIDAGYYNWVLSMQYLEQCCADPEMIEKFLDFNNKANCYYAFDVIYKYLAEPFTSCPADALVNIARYLACQKEIYKISRVSIFYTLMKQGQILGAYKLARYALEQLSCLKIPYRFEKLIETEALMIRSKPFTDAEELLPMCYRCGISNPLLGTNECIHCKNPFILSFVSFEVLPLVEFIVSDDINLEEARQLINAEPPLGQIENPLQEQMSLKTGKVMANREILLRLEKQQVIIAEWPPPFATRFYYNIIPEISIIQCNSCYRMFHADDFEIACLKTGGCPFCHVAPQKKTNRNFIGDNDIE